jgi:ABC-type dipeptide/oligopeptide/nickel transport system permease component/ABC-type dipeptide/oligopeptide/nickel transport system permease subunit
MRLPAGWTVPRILAAAFLLVVLIVAAAAPEVVSLLGLKGPRVRDPSALNLFGNPTGPGSGHPLGVDAEGRDVLSRMLYGLRSLGLLSLAGAALAVLAGGLLAQLGRLPGRAARPGRLALRLLNWPLDALAAFPPLLLGLALGLSLGAGPSRLIIALALTQLTAGLARWRATASDRSTATATATAMARRAATGLLALLPGAVVVDFGLTFLGDGPGGSTPQLGAMVARAGEGILAGVPAWWALVFPGLAVMLVLAAAAVLTGAEGHIRRPGLRILGGTRARYAGGQLLAAVLQSALVLALAAAMFESLGGSDPTGVPPLAGVGHDLAATVSLLGGGAVVWLMATLLQVQLTTSRRARAERLSGWLVRAPAWLLNAAPAGWLAFLALYGFSDSVGKLPVLPGAGSYVGLTHAPGRWAQSLLIPWLLLGLGQAARMTPELQRLIRQEAGSAQQRVARAAGVPEPNLTRQRRRTLVAPLLELTRRHAVILISLAVVIEATFRIPGAGALAVSDFGHARAATVSDLAVLAALLVVCVGLLLDWVRVLVDPRVVSG